MINKSLNKIGMINKINKTRHRKYSLSRPLTILILKKKTMIINNVPDQYFIGSGLGEAKLTELALIPLKMLEEVVGILEISSLKSIDPKKINLLELVAENIASNIINLESRAKIEKMYEVSQQQTERLHEQEEEMRQNMEELQTTQEEMSRNQASLRKKISDLELEIEHKNKLLESYKSKE